jgi:hypothetical protein
LSSFKITTLSKQSPVGRKFAQSGHPGFKVNHLLLVIDDLVEFCCLAVVEVMAGTDGAKLEKYDCVEKLGKIEIHFFVKKSSSEMEAMQKVSLSSFALFSTTLFANLLR